MSNNTLCRFECCAIGISKKAISRPFVIHFSRRSNLLSVCWPNPTQHNYTWPYTRRSEIPIDEPQGFPFRVFFTFFYLGDISAAGGRRASASSPWGHRRNRSPIHRSGPKWFPFQPKCDSLTSSLTCNWIICRHLDIFYLKPFGWEGRPCCSYLRCYTRNLETMRP